MLDSVGECEQARGRMIDEFMNSRSVAEEISTELRDHLVLESPQQAIVENKFLVMRELVQHWVAHGEFSLLQSRQ